MKEKGWEKYQTWWYLANLCIKYDLCNMFSRVQFKKFTNLICRYYTYTWRKKNAFVSLLSAILFEFSWVFLRTMYIYCFYVKETAYILFAVVGYKNNQPYLWLAFVCHFFRVGPSIPSSSNHRLKRFVVNLLKNKPGTQGQLKKDCKLRCTDWRTDRLTAGSIFKRICFTM